MTTQIQSKQHAFNAGEFSPRLFGRSDIPKYRNAVEIAKNTIGLPHGPIIKRLGSKYIADIKTHADNTRLIRFQKSAGDAFVLEFGDLYIRFYEDGVQLSGPLELITPYTKAQVFDLEFSQFGYDIFITHIAHETRRLHRNTSTVWLLEIVPISPPATVENGEFPVATVTPSATSGTAITFTASAASFLVNDTGRQIVFRDTTTDELKGVAIIIGFTSTTVVTADITVTFPDTNPIASGEWKIDLSPNATITPDSKDLGSIATVTVVANTWKADAQVTHIGRFIHIQGGIIRIDAVATPLSLTGEVLEKLK